jgi:GNAT superfamily N-acetyltransferase
MSLDSITFRTTLQPGDIGRIVYFHGTVYAAEYGFDSTFEAYVAGPRADYVWSQSLRERLWIAERAGQMIGCVAIVAASTDTAQLRWFLVEPRSRGKGLGTRLLREAIGFAEEQGYTTIVLWTVRQLVAAAHLYEAAGFRVVDERPGRMWGVDVIEEKYELRFAREAVPPRSANG